MYNKNNIILLTKLLILASPFIILIVLASWFKSDKFNLFGNVEAIFNFLFTKEFEFLILILIVGLLICILILYFMKNKVETEINRYTFSRIFSPKTYEKIKKSYTAQKLKELNISNRLKVNKENSRVSSKISSKLSSKSSKKSQKKNSKKKLNEDQFNEMINKSILLK